MLSNPSVSMNLDFRLPSDRLKLPTSTKPPTRNFDWSSSIFSIASLGVSYLLSPKNPTPEKLTPYESGIFPEEEPSQRFPVKFYMVAMLYIVFDIEIIFLLAWATRFEQLGWYGIVVIFIFTFFVLETLYYVWKRNVLDWNVPRRQRYHDPVSNYEGANE